MFMKIPIDIRLCGHAWSGFLVVTHYKLNPTKKQIDTKVKELYPPGSFSDDVSEAVLMVRRTRALRALDENFSLKHAKMYIQVLYEKD